MRACQRASITRSSSGTLLFGGGPPFFSHDDTVAGRKPRCSAICLIVQPPAYRAFTFMYSSWVIICFGFLQLVECLPAPTSWRGHDPDRWMPGQEERGLSDHEFQ